MRVAIVHSYYSSDVPSGENVAVDAQASALLGAGFDVRIFGQSTDRRRERASYKLEAAASVMSGVGPDPSEAMVSYEPDVVHVHNLVPNFGTRWLKRWRASPVVATLHNFRPICAAATLSRGGEVCTDCISGSTFSAVRHACYRGSRIETVPLAFRNRRGAANDPVISRADRVVVISELNRRIYEDAGLDPGRVAVVPNFALPTHVPKEKVHADSWIFFGRLASEKGIFELLSAWPDDRQLDVYGDGPARAVAERVSGPNVRFLGHHSNASIRSLVGHYRGMLFPSQWFEAGATLAYLESIASGVPVVAFAGNATAIEVEEQRTGVVVSRRPGVAELSGALEQVELQEPDLARRCLDRYAHHYSPEAWLSRISDTYQGALQEPGRASQ